MDVNGKTCKVLRDTGATYDVVHSSFVNESDFTGDYVCLRQGLEGGILTSGSTPSKARTSSHRNRTPLQCGVIVNPWTLPQRHNIALPASCAGRKHDPRTLPGNRAMDSHPPVFFPGEEVVALPRHLTYQSAHRSETCPGSAARFCSDKEISSGDRCERTRVLLSSRSTTSSLLKLSSTVKLAGNLEGVCHILHNCWDTARIEAGDSVTLLRRHQEKLDGPLFRTR
ncbi:hypothetical protein HPB47_028058 [Ixodes persulcatus]|uniref:Uncharacterized protein n=1 Tax=Ixodes persulcatus TaxID=34615 RepID=A0AC60PU96_IXOPE|nr:hypothetical protein HPB47_028058 [Ixodes persulcatus]